MNNDAQFTQSDYESVRKSIRSRRTWKVLADPASVSLEDAGDNQQNDDRVRAAIHESGWAPFHYDRKTGGIPEPWRFYFLNQVTCRTIAGNISSWFDDVKPNNKIPAMLSACGSLVLVNWIPQVGRDDSIKTDEKLRQVNEEHLAATSAAIQNLLLLLTARNFGTYWSSGGLFRLPTMFEKLGIDSNERLLGAIFVDYLPNEDLERIPGKLRDSRSEPNRWLHEIQL